VRNLKFPRLGSAQDGRTHALALNYPRRPDEGPPRLGAQDGAELRGQVAAIAAGRFMRSKSIYLHERPRTELKLQALRIGDLGITALPNEGLCPHWPSSSKRKPASRPTFNIEHSPMVPRVYIPTPRTAQASAATRPGPPAPRVWKSRPSRGSSRRCSACSKKPRASRAAGWLIPTVPMQRRSLIRNRRLTGG